MRKRIIFIWLFVLISAHVYCDSHDAVYVTISGTTVSYKLSQIPIITYDGSTAILTVNGNEVMRLPLKYGAEVELTWGSYSQGNKVIPVEVGKYNYSTFYSPFAITVPKDAVVFIPSLNSEQTKVMCGTPLQEGCVIPAETGIILKNKGYYYFGVDSTPAESLFSCLSGTSTKIPTSYVNGNVYTLSNEDGIMGFYNYKGEFLSAFKAFLLLQNTEAKGLFLEYNDNIATIIESKETTVRNEPVTYNLSGQKITSITHHGVYIVNGKKIIK